jgi:cytochrome c biogenesis protein CcmG, thiol:disulfide interchange protein DsbE
MGADPESQAQIALGSSGVPETYVVDGRGVIRYQHIGPIEGGDVATILAQFEAAK